MSLNIHDFLNVGVVFDYPRHRTSRDARADELPYCLDRTEIEGFVCEFGVASGASITMMAEYWMHKAMHGFDTFTGLPEDWVMGPTTYEKGRFNQNGVLPKVPSNVRLYKGLFQDTLPTVYLHGDAQLLNIDCDLYSGAKFVLEYLNDKIVPGTMLRFDELCDWRHLEGLPRTKSPKRVYTNWREHEWKALNEWVEEYDREVEPIARNYSQSSVMIVRK